MLTVAHIPTDRVADRRRSDSHHAAAAQLHRRDLSDRGRHYRIRPDSLTSPVRRWGCRSAARMLVPLNHTEPLMAKSIKSPLCAVQPNPVWPSRRGQARRGQARRAKARATKSRATKTTPAKRRRAPSLLPRHRSSRRRRCRARRQSRRPAAPDPPRSVSRRRRRLRSRSRHPRARRRPRPRHDGAARASGSTRSARQGRGKSGCATSSAARREPCRNGQSRPAGAARIHHHDGGLHLFLRPRQDLPEELKARSTRRSMRSAGSPAGASATAPIRCSSRCAPARGRRCRA